MGFAAVLFCSDRELAAASDTEVVSSLLAVLGTDDYPVVALHPQRCAPWLLAGTFHSTQSARLRLDATDPVELAPVPHRTAADLSPVGDGHRPSASPTITSAQMATATREYMGSPRRMATAAARATAEGGVDPVEVLFGPDPLEGREVAGSLWWFYMDSLGNLRDAAADPTAIAASVRAAAAARTGAEVQLGTHLNALCCAGRVAAGAVVNCNWSGNRLTILM